MRVGIWSAGVALASIVVVGAAHAGDAHAPPTVSLSWVRRPGAERCPGPNAVGSAVEGRLPHAALVAAPRADVAIEASIEPGSTARWHVAITLSAASGAAIATRELDTDEPACSLATDAAVIAMAQMIDRQGAAPDDRAATRATNPVAATAARDPSAPARVPSEASDTWQAQFDVAGTVGFGQLPHMAAGVAVHARAHPPRWPLQMEISARYDFEQRVPERLQPPAPGSFSLYAAGAALCSRAGERRGLSGFACAGAEGGVIAVHRDGWPIHPNHPWIANLLARGQGSIVVTTHFRVSAAAEVAVPLRRHEFSVLGGTESIYRMAAIAGALELGIGFAF